MASVFSNLPLVSFPSGKSNGQKHTALYSEDNVTKLQSINIHKTNKTSSHKANANWDCQASKSSATSASNQIHFRNRYHYYGIAIREHSPYFEPTYSRKFGETPDGQKKELHKEAVSSSQPSAFIPSDEKLISKTLNLRNCHIAKAELLSRCSSAQNSSSAGSASQRVRLTAVLPDFPTLPTLAISPSVDREQVEKS